MRADASRRWRYEKPVNLSRLVPALPLLAVLSFPVLAPASEDDSAAVKKAEAAMDM